jgi:hypothetical protein
MFTRQRRSGFITGVSVSLFLLAVLAVAVAALLGGEYAVPAGLVAGVAGLAGLWGGLRARARYRLQTALDAFADRELARQR